MRLSGDKESAVWISVAAYMLMSIVKLAVHVWTPALGLRWHIAFVSASALFVPGVATAVARSACHRCTTDGTKTKTRVSCETLQD
jgi:hypothetical protein